MKMSPSMAWQCTLCYWRRARRSRSVWRWWRSLWSSRSMMVMMMMVTPIIFMKAASCSVLTCRTNCPLAKCWRIPAWLSSLYRSIELSSTIWSIYRRQTIWIFCMKRNRRSSVLHSRMIGSFEVKWERVKTRLCLDFFFLTFFWKYKHWWHYKNCQHHNHHHYH